MRIPRFLITPEKELRVGDTVPLSAEDGHHLIHVLRATENSRINLVDTERALLFDAAITSTTPCEAIVQKISPLAADLQLVLLMGAPRAALSDFVVEKATELGAQSILFFEAERSQRELKEARLPRLERIAESAAKQSGTTHLPHLALLPDLTSAIRKAGAGQFQLVLSPDAPVTALNLLLSSDNSSKNHSLLQKQPERAEGILIIGPEGGLTADEISTAMRLGYSPCSLGSTTLRAETAVIAALTLVRQVLSAR